MCDFGVWIAQHPITRRHLAVYVFPVETPLDDKCVFSIIYLSGKVVKVFVCESER